MFKIKKNKFNVKISEKAKYMTPKEFCLKTIKSIKSEEKSDEKTSDIEEENYEKTTG